MAVTAFTNASVLLGDLDASPFVNNVTSALTVEMLDATVCGTGGFRSFVPGMRNGQMIASGFQDYAVGGFFEKITGPQDGGLSTLMSVAPIAPDAVLTAGDPVAFMRGPIVALTEDAGEAGQLGTMSIELANNSVFAMGSVLHPLATRSSTANGTAVAMVGPTASQTLWAGLHVTAGSGGTLTVVVATDDAVGFPSATTRITFTATTGPVAQGQMLSLTPVNISTETHVRASWTITGGSFTFAVVAGIVSNV